METKDLIGKRFNNLTVIEFAYKKNYRAYWKCRCDCGNEKIIMRNNIPKTLTCGCSKGANKYVGKFPRKLGDVYYNMKKRCDYKNHKSYNSYGGRGITYCDKWKTLEGFLDDMLDGYEEGLTLDRIDVNGMYCKENCRWVSRNIQANNKTTNIFLEYKGEKLTLSELTNKLGLNYSMVQHRIARGYTVEEAIKPPKEKEMITYNSVTKTVGEFAEEYGMTYHQLKKRLMRGWNIERALTQPLRKRT